MTWLVEQGEQEFHMSEQDKLRLEELWAKCCDMRLVMSEAEMDELWQLLGLEAQALDQIEV